MAYRGAVVPASIIDRTGPDWLSHLVNGCQAFSRAVGAPLRKRHSASEHLESAVGFLAGLPAVGLVESYDDSCQRIQSALSTIFPELVMAPSHANSSSNRHSSLEERLAEVREELGEFAYKQLALHNEHDCHLWSTAQMDPSDIQPS